MTIFQSIHKKILKLAPDIFLLKPGKMLKSQLNSKGMMDLDLEVLKIEENYIVIVLAHYYKHESGDMVPDPVMEIRLTNTGFAEALTYQDLYVYHPVYVDEDRFYPKRKKSLNAFLSQWLSNCIEQKHQLLPYK